MFEVRATESAERDLEEIHDYLVGELLNPQAWIRLSEKIADAVHTLQNEPLAFSECIDARLKGKGYRKCVLGGYLFIYRVEIEKNIVHIVRFFHGLQNYIAEL